MSGDWRTGWFASATVLLLVGLPLIMLLMRAERVPQSHEALWPEVYGLANLGGIRAITVSAMVLATAIGPGLTGVLIDAGIAPPTQMLWLAAWCLAACLVLAFAAKQVSRREATSRADGSHSPHR